MHTKHDILMCPHAMIYAQSIPIHKRKKILEPIFHKGGSFMNGIF